MDFTKLFFFTISLLLALGTQVESQFKGSGGTCIYLALQEFFVIILNLNFY